MHKSKGNAIWFDDVMEKIGADPMRLLYCLQNPGQELRFGFNVTKEPKNNLNILYNISRLIKKGEKTGKYSIEDKWILSKFNSLAKKVTEELDGLHPHIACRELQEFWLKEASRRYIQIVRERLAEDDESANSILLEIYIGLLKLCAPIIPFITEKIWQELREKNIVKEESAHLTDWPKVDKKKIDSKLESEFDIVFEIVEKGLAERDKIGIGLKWPLSRAICGLQKRFKLRKELLEIVKRQINIKEIKLKESEQISVSLDTTMTPELEAEGYAREFVRNVQVARKKEGLEKGQLVEVNCVVEDSLRNMLDRHMKFLRNRIHAKKLEFVDKLENKTAEFEIKGKKVTIRICNF